MLEPKMRHHDVDRPAPITSILNASVSDVKAIKRAQRRLGHIISNDVFEKAVDSVRQRIHAEIAGALDRLITMIERGEC